MVRCGVDGDHFLPVLLSLLVLLVARGVLTGPVRVGRGGAGGEGNVMVVLGGVACDGGAEGSVMC